MPIYEYKCSTCGNGFEKLMKVRADAPPCPECGSDDVQKQVSASGFILKGSGWYKDHYGLKSGGSGDSDSKSSSSSSSSTPSGDSKSSSDSSSKSTTSPSSASSKAKAISSAAKSST